MGVDQGVTRNARSGHRSFIKQARECPRDIPETVRSEIFLPPKIAAILSARADKRCYRIGRMLVVDLIECYRDQCSLDLPDLQFKLPPTNTTPTLAQMGGLAILLPKELHEEVELHGSESMRSVGAEIAYRLGVMYWGCEWESMQ